MAYQSTSFTVVYSTAYSDADQRKHQSSASLAFVWGNHRNRWIPRTKGHLHGKCFHLMTSSWVNPSRFPGTAVTMIFYRMVYPPSGSHILVWIGWIFRHCYFCSCWWCRYMWCIKIQQYQLSNIHSWFLYAYWWRTKATLQLRLKNMDVHVIYTWHCDDLLNVRMTNTQQIYAGRNKRCRYIHCIYICILYTHKRNRDVQTIWLQYVLLK